MEELPSVVIRCEGHIDHNGFDEGYYIICENMASEKVDGKYLCAQCAEKQKDKQ
jgi:hypothetical protein